MLKKRLIGVITVRDGQAVQSFGYQRYLPLGRAAVLAENLDRWHVDEIILQCIDQSANSLGPNMVLLGQLSRAGLATPLIYAGGIQSEEDGVRVIQAGADRICLDALLHEAPRTVELLSKRLGAQALVASLPLKRSDGEVLWFNYRTRACTPLSSEVLALLSSGTISEAMVIDYEHEGFRQGFDRALVDDLPFEETPIIVFGGVSERAQMEDLLGIPRVVAVAIGNFLNYREHAVRHFKQQLAGLPLRIAS